MKNILNGCVFVAVMGWASNVFAISPYLISGQGGDYAVMDPESDTVVSTGSLKKDLLSASTTYDALYLLDDWLADSAHDRAIFNWGKRGDERDGVSVYSGKLIVGLSDRRLLFAVNNVKGKWEPYHEVGPNNRIYFSGWGPGLVPKTIVYDGVTYSVIDSSSSPVFGFRGHSTCFVPGVNRVFDNTAGIYDIGKNKLVVPLPDILRETVHVDCGGGKVLLYATGKKNVKLPGEGIYVYDLILETTTVRIAGSVLGDDPSSDWRLSPDGKYAIWQEREEVGVVGGTGSFETGRFTFYSAETGKKTGEIKLPEKKWEDYQFGTSTWVNGFSLDGKKLLVCSSPYLYVIDIGTAKVLHKVKIPFTPGNNGEGFVVWP